MSSIDTLETSIDAIEYLARSPSRVKVLNKISEAPQARHELREITDVSRVTLSRLLSTLEGRGWIERTGKQYRATEQGRFVVEEFLQLLENIQTFDELDTAMAWLPTDEFAFDLSCLREAVVTTSNWTDHTASIRRVADAISESERIRGTASGVSREVVEALRDSIVHGQGSVEVVLDPTALEIVRGDSELSGTLAEMVDAGAEIARYSGDEDLLMVLLCDDTVLMCGQVEDGPPPGTLETTNEAVRYWAESYFDSVRSTARSVEAEAFTA